MVENNKARERERDEGGYRKFFEIEYAEKYLSNL